jgi:hypothetical protein
VRLYFHLVSDRHTIQDTEGIEVDCMTQALFEARRALDELKQERPGAARDWFGWTLSITAPGGNVVLSIDLGRVVE